MYTSDDAPLSTLQLNKPYYARFYYPNCTFIDRPLGKTVTYLIVVYSAAALLTQLLTWRKTRMMIGEKGKFGRASRAVSASSTVYQKIESMGW